MKHKIKIAATSVVAYCKQSNVEQGAGNKASGYASLNGYGKGSTTTGQGRREDLLFFFWGGGVPRQIQKLGPRNIDCVRGVWGHTPRKFLRFYML